MAWLECGGGGVTPTLLWTNPNPTASFSAQTLNIDLSQYECLFVETEGNKYTSGLISYHQMEYVDLSVESYSICGRYSINSNTYVSIRVITAHTNNSISFSNGSAGTTTDGRLCIPIKIYGLKKRIFNV